MSAQQLISISLFYTFRRLYEAQTKILSSMMAENHNNILTIKFIFKLNSHFTWLFCEKRERKSFDSFILVLKFCVITKRGEEKKRKREMKMNKSTDDRSNH